jgi:ribulose-phosphate 3-epimerase
MKYQLAPSILSFDPGRLREAVAELIAAEVDWIHCDAFARAGCSRVIFQVEVAPHAHRLCQTLRAAGLEAGVAINPGTPVEALAPLLDVMDLALVMTVNPGWGGQPLIDACLEKVRRLRSWRPDLMIEVDGGIDASTLPRALAAGANVFVSGSYLVQAGSVAAGVTDLRRAMG